jgi:centrin-1
MFDDDNTGRLNFKNLRRIANELGEALTDAELQDMIEEVDRTGEGNITFDDFFRVMNKKEGSLDDFSDED